MAEHAGRRIRRRRIQPDLSRIAVIRSREMLIRSIREPGASVAAGYRAVTLVTRDGERIRGVAKSEDSFSILIVDTNERLQGYIKADLEELIHAFLSSRGSSTSRIASPTTLKEKAARVMMTLRDDIQRVWAQATLSRWSVGRCPR